MKILKALLIVSFFFVSIKLSAQSEKEQIRKFNMIDADRNEVITIREMKRYYKDKVNKDGGPVDAKKLFYGLDANRNSIITLNEYIKGVDWKLAYEYADKWDYKITEDDNTAKTDEEKDKQSEKFDKIDSNLDGTLSFEEVVNYHKGMVNKKTGKPINGKLNFYTYDADNNGMITTAEFVADLNWKQGWLRLKAAEEKGNSVNSNQPSEAYVKKQINIFYEVDLDKNFKITLEELKLYFKDKKNNKGEPINSEFKFYGLDKNEDGTIELAEFASKIDLDLAKRRYKARKQ